MEAVAAVWNWYKFLQHTYLPLNTLTLIFSTKLTSITSTTITSSIVSITSTLIICTLTLITTLVVVYKIITKIIPLVAI